VKESKKNYSDADGILSNNRKWHLRFQLSKTSSGYARCIALRKCPYSFRIITAPWTFVLFRHYRAHYELLTLVCDILSRSISYQLCGL